MRILKYLFVTLALILLAIVAVGFFKPTVEYKCDIIIEKPVAESMAVMQDETKLSEWLTGFKKIEHISGVPGTVGAVSDVYFDNGGQEMSIRETITQVVQNESIAMSYDSDMMQMDYKMILSNIEGNTQIESYTVVRGSNIIYRALMALSPNTFISQEETNLSLLKAVIERNTKIYSPTVSPDNTVLE